jgi:hypothetical protein
MSGRTWHVLHAYFSNFCQCVPFSSTEDASGRQVLHTHLNSSSPHISVSGFNLKGSSFLTSISLLVLDLHGISTNFIVDFYHLLLTKPDLAGIFILRNFHCPVIGITSF